MRHALFVIVGTISGVLSGAFGVGGAIISTPLLRALGVPPVLAIATTLPAVIPSAATGSWQYHRAGHVRWKIVSQAAPVGIMASIWGAYMSPGIPGRGHLQMLLTAVLLGYVAVKLGTGSDAPKPRTYSRLAPGIIGLGAGLMSGVLGVGGGLVTVPGFRQWLRLPLKDAIATSLACVGLFAFSSTITHSIAGTIDWIVALEVAVGVIPGAIYGSQMAIKAKDRTLRLVVGSLLGCISVVYAFFELRALLS